MNKIIWQSSVTADMVAGMDDYDIQSLIEALDDAVQATCEDWGMACEDEEME
jgi:hypothetical protein